MNVKILIIACVLFLSGCITDPNTGLNPRVVQDAIVSHYPAIQKCYSQSIGADGHTGVIQANFVIDKEGHAKSIRLADESLGTDKVYGCLQDEIKAISFPKPKGGVDVVVAYPFKFEADKSLSQAAILAVLKNVNAAQCFDEIASTNGLKIKLTIGKLGRVQKTLMAFDNTELKESSPCLAKVIGKQKFPKIGSKQFQSVSLLITFEAEWNQGPNPRVSQSR
ncbi:MAG: AgmX/PglI C-terminal domain-containing protein [Proteobacteria bacterium]|nr:MAG: AgmX/PglI C-terminal domain-containing protein [Pseudomonadota bacterium]